MSTFQPAKSAAGAFITNPKQLPVGAFTSISIKNGPATVAVLSAAGTFTPLANGGAVAAIAAAGTFVTVCDIAGGGYLSAVVGALFNGLRNAQIRITADGVQTTIGVGVSLPSYYRLILGAVHYHVAQAQGTTAANISHLRGAGTGDDYGFYDAKSGALVADGQAVTLMPPLRAIAEGLPVLRFETSLKVEVLDGGLDATADPNRKCAALYVLDI